MKTEFLTPVGRLVQGDAFTAQTTNQQGQPLRTQAGEPTQRYFIAVAFRKDDPAFAALWAKIDAAGRAAFPGMMIAPPWDPNCRFSWKVMDGDGIDDNNKPNANKPGFAGHWVVKFQSSFAPKVFYAGRYAPHEQVNDKNALPRGYYVRVSGTMEGNAQQQKPGLYMNLGLIEIVGGSPSDIIVSGPDATQVFGGQAAVLPPGVQAVVPVAPGAQVPQGMPGMPQQPAAMPMPQMQPQPQGMPMPQMQPQPQGMPAAMPGAPMGMPQMPQQPAAMPGAPMGMPQMQPTMVQPNPAFLAGPGGMPQMQPQQPAAMPMPTPQAQPRMMTPKAGAFTYEQFIGQGFTDDMLRQQGYMM